MGENHSLALTRAGELYSWGHGDRGRLGIGHSHRVGVGDPERSFFASPMLVRAFAKEPVRQASTMPSLAEALPPGAMDGHVSRAAVLRSFASSYRSPGLSRGRPQQGPRRTSSPVEPNVLRLDGVDTDPRCRRLSPFSSLPVACCVSSCFSII